MNFVRPAFKRVHKLELEFSKNSAHFILTLSCLSFLVVIDWLMRWRMEEENMFLGRLRIYVFVKFIIGNIFVALVVRNSKMSKFCVNQMK